jgi:hypothetical protein
MTVMTETVIFQGLIPDYRGVESTQADFHALLERISKSQRWISERTGISERRLRYLAAGGRLVSGEFTPTSMSYIEQFALESLARCAEVMRLP